MIGKALRNAIQGGHRRRYAEYEVGAVTAAMGLQLRSGDPAFNLTIDAQKRIGDVNGGSRTAMREQLDMVADGTVDGRPVQFVWRDDASSKRGVLGRTITYSSDLRLSMTARSTLAPFELLHTKHPMSSVPMRPLLTGPAQSLGDRTLDKRFRLTSPAPLPPAVTAQLIDLTDLAWLHLVWDGEALSYQLSPYYGMVFDDPAALLGRFLTLAAVLEQSP